MKIYELCRQATSPLIMRGGGESPEVDRQTSLSLENYFSPRELQTALKISSILPVPLTELNMPFFL